MLKKKEKKYKRIGVIRHFNGSFPSFRYHSDFVHLPFCRLPLRRIVDNMFFCEYSRTPVSFCLRMIYY